MELKQVTTINFRDLIMECVDCAGDFTFTRGEQVYFASKGLSTPRRCPECRLKRKLTLAPEVNND